MNGLAWLNDLMVWLARWIPRIVLIKATHEGVLFGPNGRVARKRAGLHVYWPISHDLTLVSTRQRTMEVSPQLHGREVVQVVVLWTIKDPVALLLAMNDIGPALDDRTQAALACAYAADKTSDVIADDVKDRLNAFMKRCGVVVDHVDVAQRGPVRSFRVIKDWSAAHEATTL
jgi:regulator of protease activity HflC (stomatin/prohibitin superfamily)